MINFLHYRFRLCYIIVIITINFSFSHSSNEQFLSNANENFTLPIVPATNSEKLYNATCPMINTRALSLTQLMNATGDWCLGGSLDGINQCAGSIEDCKLSPNYDKVAQGIAQDSIYSTNPPYWWRCNYTSIIETVIPGINGTNSTIVSSTKLEQLPVINPECFRDSRQCRPLRYLTQINNLNSNGSAQWPGQLFPPYSRLERPPLAVVIAGAAFVNASIFYPSIDQLQLLQIQQSAHQTFLSFSSSTRIVVEMPGNVLTNSRTRISPDCQLIVPFFTLIINLSDGYPDDAAWQDDCSTCSEEYYVYSDDGSCNCGVPKYSCINPTRAASSNITASDNALPVNSIDCDLKFYVAYSGSDKNGNVLTSSSRTIKIFRKYSINDLYKNIVNNYDNFDGIDNSFSGCTEWITINGEQQCLNWG